MTKQNWKDRLNIVYSTKTDFEYEAKTEQTQEITLPPAQQKLYVGIDKKQRGGKLVTLISGFVGNETDLKELGRFLKLKCGVGGNVKDGNILIQGDFREKVLNLLIDGGYKAKRSN